MTVARPDPSALQALLDGPHAAEREATRTALCSLDLAQADGLPREDYRDLVLDWCRRVAKTGSGARSFPTQYGGADDPGGRVAGFQTLGHGDLSLLVKVGVQFGLFGGSVHRLGTERHHERYLRDIGTLDLPGCFAMSESGHGSDVRSIRTQARYDAAAGEFVLHTPDESARKDWIGNLARHGRLAVVFAQLDVAGEQRGVHAFLVPLRDEDGALLEGVEVEDCGDKMGLQGVDNGRLRLSAVRIPRDALLDRFGQVSADGDYTSQITSPGARFFTMIGALVEGRICIGGAGLSVARNALTIAVRWGERRRQFGTGLDMDTPLMDYLTHQRRLLPAVATSYALQSAHDALTEQYATAVLGSPTTEEQRSLEAFAAGLKAYATWHMVGAVQQARECCGGKGYLAENRFAALRNDSDVFVTFEGDNTVLMQLVAKTLLSDYASQFEDLDAVGMARHLTTRQVSRWLDRFTTPTVALRDPEWQAAGAALPRGAHRRRAGPAAAAAGAAGGHGRAAGPVALPGPRPRRGDRPRRAGRARALRRHRRGLRHRGAAARAGPRGAVGDRARPGLVGRARLPVRRGVARGGHRGQRAVPGAAAARPGAGRGLRHPRRAAPGAHRDRAAARPSRDGLVESHPSASWTGALRRRHDLDDHLATAGCRAPGGHVTTSRRALLRAGLLAASVPLLGAAVPAQRTSAAGPNGIVAKPRSAAWVEHGRIARAAGMEREVSRCGVVKVLWGAATAEKAVALTFDDGPSAEWTAATLDVLRAADAQATFFVVGRQVRRFPDLVRRQRDEGHEHGNHTDTHADLSVLTEEQVRDQLSRTDDAISSVTGRRPTLMRPPFGHLSGAALAAAGELDYDIALWTSSMNELRLSAQGNVDALLGDLRPGGVLLSHDFGDARRGVGLAALPGLLAGLADQGYRTVTVSELLALDAAGTTTRA